MTACLNESVPQRIAGHKICSGRSLILCASQAQKWADMNYVLRWGFAILPNYGRPPARKQTLWLGFTLIGLKCHVSVLTSSGHAGRWNWPTGHRSRNCKEMYLCRSFINYTCFCLPVILENLLLWCESVLYFSLPRHCLPALRSCHKYFIFTSGLRTVPCA